MTYISVTHKVLKPCRNKMATVEHDVCHVHGASSLYIKTCLQSFSRFSLLGGWGSPPTNQKFAHSPPPNEIFIPSHQKSSQPKKKNKNVIFSCSHCSCTIFILISYSFETQIMLILILIDVQYSQNAAFSFEKFSNHQNHTSGSHHLVKKSPQQCSLLFDTKSGKLLKF